MGEPGKKRIFILSRGMRLARLFAETARCLSGKCEVHVTLGDHPEFGYEEDERRVWDEVPGVILHDLKAERDRALAKRKERGQSLAEATAEVEARLGMTAYQASSNYLLYRRFSKAYYKEWHGLYASEEQIQREFVGAHDFFSEVFDRLRPSLLFCEMIDLASHRVAAAVAADRGVFPLNHAFSAALGSGNVFFGAGSNNRNVLLEFFYARPGEIQPASWSRADELLASYGERAVAEDSYIGKLRSQAGRFLSPERLKLARDRLKDIRPALVHREISRLKNVPWLDRHFKMELPREPYVLFSLHHQPEANTKLTAPRWVDQDRIIEQLAVHAPAGMRIVVKENPRTYGLRGREYFGPLIELPNVHLLHPGFDNRMAIRRASALLTIAGTVGLEGIFMRKRVASLAPVSYTFYPGVRMLAYPDQIFAELRDRSWAPESLGEELRKFAAAYVESCFILGEGVGLSPWPEPGIGGRNYAAALERFLGLVEKFGLDPRSYPMLR